MSGQSAVDRAAMAKAAGDIENSANIIRGLQGQLQGHKEEVRAGWAGQASMAFETVFTRFDEDFKKVLQQLEQMHERLSHTKLEYESKEQMSHEAVNKVQQLLSGLT